MTDDAMVAVGGKAICPMALRFIVIYLNILAILNFYTRYNKFK